MIAILGISAFYHDSAAALLVDGQIVAAAQEERFTRKKYDERFPVHAIDYCLKEAGIEASQLDYVGFYDKPYLKFERLLETYLSYAPRGYESFLKAMPVWLNEKLRLPREMRLGLKNAYRKQFIFTQHHESHAASAFYPSPFEEAAILTLDGVGEWATASFGYGRGAKITLTHEQRFPHSLGLLYSAFTHYCGFSVNSGEYKLMGLAPYGAPRYSMLIKDHLLDLKEDGSFRMDMSYFNYCHGLTMTSRKFHNLFGGSPREPDALLTERDMDLAASIQDVTEEIMLKAARHVHAQTGMKRLCMAGGVALNCVGNGRILREGPFEELWIQPASGDAGGALGVATFIWHQLLEQPRVPNPADAQSGSLLGPQYSNRQIQEFLDGVSARYERIDDEQKLVDRVADEIRQSHVIGWFQGRMEFGPRALGSRSILGDPRNTSMRTVMNLKVKFREGFRPFAPAVLREDAARYFNVPEQLDSPYMLLVAPVQNDKRRTLPEAEARVSGIGKLKVNRSEIPAVTHVDYSARVQTVDPDRHGIYRSLLEAFYRKTGCPVLVNTSFNLGWDPIVCTPQEAYSTFMSCDMDVLCMGRFLLLKRVQPASASDVDTFDQFEELLCCPCGRGSAFTEIEGAFVGTDCGHRFQIADGIPQFVWFDDKSGEVSTSAPETNYDECETVRSLIEKARQNSYSRALDEAIPYNSSVLEVGCGAGQLSNFLGSSCRRVVGVDRCLTFLRLGEKFRREHNLARVRFIRANLFQLPFRREQFDVILCHDPRAALQGLLPLLRPGGHIVMCLPNTFRRLINGLRRQFFHIGNARQSTRTKEEVFDAFQQAGLEFVPRGSSRPKLLKGELRRSSKAGEPSFVSEPSAWGRVSGQPTRISAGSQKRSFCVVIGRRPNGPQESVRIALDHSVVG